MSKEFVSRLLWKEINSMSDCYYEHYKKYGAKCDFIEYLKLLGWDEKYNKYDEPVIFQREYKVAVAEKFMEFLRKKEFYIFKDIYRRGYFYIFKEGVKASLEFSQGIKSLISNFQKKIGLPRKKAYDENLTNAIYRQLRSEFSFVDSVKHFINANNFKESCWDVYPFDCLYDEYKQWCYEKTGYVPVRKNVFLGVLHEKFLTEKRGKKIFVYLEKRNCKWRG